MATANIDHRGLQRGMIWIYEFLRGKAEACGLKWVSCKSNELKKPYSKNLLVDHLRGGQMQQVLSLALR